jgi:hypothetical protein
VLTIASRPLREHYALQAEQTQRGLQPHGQRSVTKCMLSSEANTKVRRISELGGEEKAYESIIFVIGHRCLAF